MSIKINIPVPLQKLTKNKEKVKENYEGTIIGLVNYLDKKYPGIGERLSRDNKINKFVNFYLNEEDIRFLDYENTKIKDGDEISIIPALSGGSGLYKLIKKYS